MNFAVEVYRETRRVLIVDCCVLGIALKGVYWATE